MLKISRTHKVFCRILSSRVGAKETTTRNCWFAWEGKRCEMWLSVNRILDAITLFPPCFLNFHMFHHRSYIIHSSCCAYIHVPPVACRSDMEHQQHHDEHQQWKYKQTTTSWQRKRILFKICVCSPLSMKNCTIRTNFWFFILVDDAVDKHWWRKPKKQYDRDNTSKIHNRTTNSEFNTILAISNIIYFALHSTLCMWMNKLNSSTRHRLVHMASISIPFLSLFSHLPSLNSSQHASGRNWKWWN